MNKKNRKYIWAVWGILLTINIGFAWEFQNLGAARNKICIEKNVDVNYCKAFDVRFCGYNNSEFTKFKDAVGAVGIEAYRDQLEGIDRWFPFSYLILGLFSLLLLKDDVGEKLFWGMLCLLLAACFFDSLENLRNLKMLGNTRMSEGFASATHYYTVIKFVTLVISYGYLIIMGLYFLSRFIIDRKNRKTTI